MNKQLPQHGEWDGEVPAHPIECERTNTDEMDILSYLEIADFIQENCWGYEDDPTFSPFDFDYCAYVIQEQFNIRNKSIQDVVTRWQRMDGPKAPDAMGEIRAILEGR